MALPCSRTPHLRPPGLTDFPCPQCDPPGPAILGGLDTASRPQATRGDRERPPFAGRWPEARPGRSARPGGGGGAPPGLGPQPVAFPTPRPRGPSPALTRSGSAPPRVPVTFQPVRPRFKPAPNFAPARPGPTLSLQAAILPRGTPGNPAESPRRSAAASSGSTEGAGPGAAAGGASRPAVSAATRGAGRGGAHGAVRGRRRGPGRARPRTRAGRGGGGTGRCFPRLRKGRGERCVRAQAGQARLPSPVWWVRGRCSKRRAAVSGSSAFVWENFTRVLGSFPGRTEGSPPVLPCFHEASSLPYQRGRLGTCHLRRLCVHMSPVRRASSKSTTESVARGPTHTLGPMCPRPENWRGGDAFSSVEGPGVG